LWHFVFVTRVARETNETREATNQKQKGGRRDIDVDASAARTDAASRAMKKKEPT
jgi:hypothetical protein